MNKIITKGFTLIELMVVTSIISLLSSGVLSSVVSAREKAIDAAKMLEARQIATAAELYRSDYGGYYSAPGAGKTFEELTADANFSKYLPKLSQNYSSGVNRYVSSGDSFEVLLSLNRSSGGNNGCNQTDYESIGSSNSACIGSNSGSSIWSGPNTSGPDSTPPSMPGNFVVQKVSPNSVSISWSNSSDSGGSGLSGYSVYRNNSLMQTTALSYSQDINISNVGSYCYAVEAYDGSGNKSTRTSDVCVSIASPPTSAVSIVTRLNGQVITLPNCTVVLYNYYSGGNANNCSFVYYSLYTPADYSVTWYGTAPSGGRSSPIISPVSLMLNPGKHGTFFLDF